MILISNKKKWRLCKLIAETKHIATYSVGETDKETRFENMAKIVGNLADIAYEIGGSRFAGIDVLSYEYDLQEKMKKEKSE